VGTFFGIQPLLHEILRIGIDQGILPNELSNETLRRHSMTDG
jgi:hypothetical protein